MLKLKQLFTENWGKILLSYLLFSVQSILMVIYPKVLGDTIDHLLLKDYTYMLYLGLTFSGLMLFDYISKIYDTKVFSKIYRRFASRETHKQLENGVETTKINGRITLMGSIVNFFERDMLTILHAIFGLLGSLYFISLVDVTMVWFLIGSGVLTLLATAYFMPTLTRLTMESNDITEDQTEVIDTRRISLVNNLLRKRQKLMVSMSNVDAKFSVSIQIIAYATVTGLLTFYVMNNNVTVGGAFSTYRYLFDFCVAVTYIPHVITSFINIKDVIKRLETEKEN